jgi:hypothetical protein
MVLYLSNSSSWCLVSILSFLDTFFLLHDDAAYIILIYTLNKKISDHLWQLLLDFLSGQYSHPYYIFILHFFVLV